MPTFNRADMLNCTRGYHDFSDDAAECHVYGCATDEASVPHPQDFDSANDVVALLSHVESFLEGFEDDSSQEGVAQMLVGIRSLIVRERDVTKLLEVMTGTEGRTNG